MTNFNVLLRFATFALTLALLSTALADPPPHSHGKDNEDPPELPSYSMTLLGTLGGDGSVATAINGWGDVVGWTETGETTSSGIPVEEPFVYFNNTGTMHLLRDLVNTDDQTFWIWKFRTPRGINSAGQICMQLGTNANGPHESYGVRITLEFDENGIVIPGGGDVETVAPDYSNARGINEFGDVTGRHEDAFVYSDDFGFKSLGALGSGFSAGYAINDLGEVTGDSRNPDGEMRAFRYAPGSGMQDLGVIASAGPQSKDASRGRDINDLGVVVGFATAGKHKGNQVVHAFREDGSGMEDLGALGGAGNWSWAYGINADGWIIGESEVDDGSRREFLYADAFGMVELEPLIVELPAGAALIDAAQINDAGEIAATISYGDGTGEAVLLTPTP